MSAEVKFAKMLAKGEWSYPESKSLFVTYLVASTAKGEFLLSTVSMTRADKWTVSRDGDSVDITGKAADILHKRKVKFFKEQQAKRRYETLGSILEKWMS